MFLGIKVVLTNRHGMKVVEAEGEVAGVAEVLTVTDLVAAVEVFVVQTAEVLAAQIAALTVMDLLAAVGTEVSVVLTAEVLAVRTVAEALEVQTAVVAEALAGPTVVVVEVLEVQTVVVARLDHSIVNGLTNLPHLNVKIPVSGRVKNLAIGKKIPGPGDPPNARDEADGVNGLTKPQYLPKITKP